MKGEKVILDKAQYLKCVWSFKEKKLHIQTKMFGKFADNLSEQEKCRMNFCLWNQIDI